ncbi:hypothetical protein TSAR_016787 [Trichomalopsis sarcophagae]|uniref:Fanconi anemia group M protein n=1 Tax=Trichomalopsis sarcophagae TaxID=543379 RepID=A0A232F6M8_9HYME|nr:hypothetical protein TSAR_016787 [Trichomalopsis sarcophagae]
MAQQQVPSLSQGNFISSDQETAGFDLSSGSKWIYPENYPRRDYQFSIVQTALYNNTLVCLPTGLGKTFIAAVVMYNFWRWYPRGRVVFLAPTKPLVAQQIEACHEIMGIPSEETVELTGAINQVKRKQAWIQKRVVFATPQTFQKDLQNDSVPCQLIKCIVIDEAHKALGKHSYCEIVRMMSEKTKFFRILALSATPGSRIDHVREVIQNLLISELELRDDSSPDITPYTNDRSMEKIIVGLGTDLTNYKDRYVNIMDPHVRILVKNKILQTNTANISKGRIFMLLKQCESRPQKPNNHGIIMKTLNILLTMYHAYELLVKHGLRAFYNFYITHSDKFWLDSELDLQLLLEDIKRYIGEFPVIRPLPDGTIPDIPSDLKFGHNKFDKLRELLTDHFRSFAAQNKSTRAIVFVEYRDIVNEVYVLLLQTRPLIRPQMFVGQAGQKQKEQLAALEDFRNDKVNVLISTSVGEEGLDVGEVDLIICFDISSSTPTRLVQRMGRTGRKRSGRVVILLTEGKEVQTLNQALCKKDSLNSKVLQSSNIASSLYQSSPRMIPANVTPECAPIFIKAQPKTPKVKGKRQQINPPGERKPRKSKKDAVVAGASAGGEDFEPMEVVPGPSTSKAGGQKASGSTQPSMMMFLTEQRPQKKQPSSTVVSSSGFDNDSGILMEEFQPISRPNSSDPYSYIRPSDVKLLTSDSHALEFLTLCAMKKSEQESDQKAEPYLQIDRTWLPKRTPPRLEMFEELEIPNLDILDCIKNLCVYEKTEEEMEVHCLSDESVHEFAPLVVEDNDTRQSDFFNNFASPPKSKYAEASEQRAQMVKEVAEADFFADDFSASGNSVRKSESIGSDFFDVDFSLQKEEPQYKERSRETSVELNERTPGKEIFQPRDQSRESSVESKPRTPAKVEVDFTALLDEGTESESSQCVEASVEGSNIFDELLEADDSSDETEMFDTTVLPNRTLVGKRSASRSPEHEKEEPVAKRQKTEESSDSEAVPGTPPKDKDLSRSILSYSIGSIVPEPAAAADDSDVDMFEDMDFETQFTFRDTKLKQSPVKQDVEKKEKIAAGDELVFDDPSILDSDNDRTLLPAVEELNTKEEKDSKDKSMLPVAKEPNADVRKVDNGKSKVKTSTNSFDFDDWMDDFDFDLDACVVEKEKIERNTRSQEASTSGWIDSKMPAPLSLKNSNKPSLSLKKKPDDVHKKVLSVLGVPRPNAGLLSLKRDKDGFAMPSIKLNNGGISSSNKENSLPRWHRDKNISPRFRKYHSENNITIDSHKEEERRKRTKSRKRIANNFLDDEAEVSSDLDTSEGSSCGEEDKDKDLESFVSYTQDVHEDEDMRAHYLQTVNKSPIRSGAFMFKKPREVVPMHEIYSQPITQSQANDTYMHDSFCVGDETQIDDIRHDSESSSSDSILDSIESSSESRRRKVRDKKREKFKVLKDKRRMNKNKRELSSSSSSNACGSSSEDETEALRRQVLEESMMMKKKKSRH